MPRPRKWRKVCCLPSSTSFGPLNGSIQSDIFLTMTVDEYETIRLIDMEGFTQEACADHMHIARTTVQRIYNDARKKLAECLVNGKILRIEGGDFQLCDGLEETCGCGGCLKHRIGRGTAGKKRNWGVSSLSISESRGYQKRMTNDDKENKNDNLNAQPGGQSRKC